MAGTTSLLKSASSTRDQLAAYNDQVKAFEYSNSAYTDEAFNEYAIYLEGRIKELSGSGSISNASKALSLTKALDGATKSNISSAIQRENIQMLSGNATLTDKYGVIVQQYSRAVANGDMTLAQSLMSQAYSVNQSIQYQNQQAADARASLAKAAGAASETAGKAEAAKEGDIVQSLKQSLGQLSNDIKVTGMGGFNKTVKQWVDANKDTLQALGVKLPNQPNYFDVVQGVGGAMYNHNMLASQMYAPYGTGPGSQSWDFALKAYNINAGIDKLHTLAGDLTVQQVMQAAADPNRFVYSPDQGKFIQTQQTGNKMVFDKPGQGPTLTPTFSGQVQKVITLPPDMVNQMNKLSLDFKHGKDTPDGIQVQATNQTPKWLQDVIGKGGVTHVYAGENGDLTFTGDAKDGTGLAVYHVVKDTNGHMGVYYQGQQSEGFLRGEYGFNSSMINNPKEQKGSLLNGKGNNALKSPASMFGKVNSQNITNIVGQATGNYQVPLPPPIPLQGMPELPSISLPSPQAPTQSISVAPNVANSQPVVPKTVSIQGGTPGIQGSAVNPQTGGTGIKITGTTNKPVGMKF